MDKLAILYTIMSNFTVHIKNRDHIRTFLSMINATDIGKIILQLSTKLYGAEYETVFYISDRKDGVLWIGFYVDKAERLVPYIPVMQGLEAMLASYGIKMEVDTMENFQKSELVPF